MGINSRALYSDLVKDLQGHIPFSVESEVIPSSPWPDASIKAWASCALLNSFYKKYVEAKKEDADALALKKFLEINSLCEHWSFKPELFIDSYLMDEFKSRLYSFFNVDYLHSPSYNEILSHGDLGPGANLKGRGNDFYTKMFSSPMTCSDESLYTIYVKWVHGQHRLEAAEKLRSDMFGSHELCQGNRLSFVPKADDISRSICTEPILNMFFQKGYGYLIERRLRSFFSIDLSTQPFFNRVLSKVGSEDNSFTTIDLSSASDSMSLSMLKEVLPRHVFSYLVHFRSKSSLLPNQQLVPLHMVSTMGNAFTFPLQTVLFSCVVSTAYRWLGLTQRLNSGTFPGNWAVFGDDIIVLRSADRLVRRLLVLLGFRVNVDKSFNDGYFKESCGYDFYHGTNVRGVYVKSLRSEQDLYSLINRLNRWSAYHKIPLVHTVSHLMRNVRTKVLVPYADNDDAGIKVPYSFVAPMKRDPFVQSIKYRRWIPRERYLRITDEAVLSPRAVKKRIFNPEGLYLCSLKGSLRACKISIKLDRVLYRLGSGITPYWDFVPVQDGPTGPDLIGQVGWSCWENMTSSNLR